MVVLELQHVVSWIQQNEGLMLFATAREANKLFFQESQSFRFGLPQDCVEVVFILESDAEVSRIECRALRPVLIVEVTDELVPKKLESHSVIVGPRNSTMR
jgi:hypothetical protein